MTRLTNIALLRAHQVPHMSQRQTGCASLEGVVIGTAVAIIALYMALGGNVGSILVFFSR